MDLEQRRSLIPEESHRENSTTCGNALSGPQTGAGEGSQVVTPIDRRSRTPRARCHDVGAWIATVSAAGDELAVKGRVRARTVKDVAERLALHMGADGYGRPGSATLAQELELGQATVERCLSSLVRNGYLDRDVNAGGPNRHAVYLATLPTGEHGVTPRTPPESMASRHALDPKAWRSATHSPGEHGVTPRSDEDTQGFVKTKNHHPLPPPGQLVLPAQLQAVGGGGKADAEGQPPTISDALQRVVDKLPAHLAEQLLEHPELVDVDRAVAAAAEALPIRDIVEQLTSGLPGVVGDIVALWRKTPSRLPALASRVKGRAAAAEAERRQRAETARRWADQVALGGTSRSDFVDFILPRHYADDAAAWNAALEAFDQASDEIRRHEETS